MITNPLVNNPEIQAGDPTTYTNNVMQAVISIFFIVGLVYFIWHFLMAGYHLISTEGDPKKLETAKNQITYALLGLIVIFSVFALLKFVGTILGIDGLESLQITWPTL
ncbi:pilin [Patescibacteria group bacterium]|nr:pilin [Patescibacteria group bacterium]